VKVTRKVRLEDLAAQIAAGRKALQERELNALRTNWE